MLSGLFIAKISRGKTVREFLLGTLTAPVLFSYLWVVFFGGSAIRLERDSAGAGLCCNDKSGWFLRPDELMSKIVARNYSNEPIPKVGPDWMFRETPRYGHYQV